MNNFIKKYHKILLYLFFMISIIYILIYIHPSTIDFDENYTLALINHNWHQIIYLDSLDVHPPLYYLILKIFINIFTFWTDYLPIKIIFARLLSLVISIISFIYLYKISKKLNIKNNIIIMWINFVFLPIVLGMKFPLQQMINIRMYALAGLFIIIEFYYLLKFSIDQNDINLIIVVISAIFSFYTHYYAAIFAGLLLIAYFIKFLFYNIKDSIKIFISGFIVILSYVPWMKSFFRQMNTPTTYWLTSMSLIKQSIIFLTLILIFIYPIFYYYKNVNNHILNEQIIIMLSVLFVTFVFSLVYSIINHPMFLLRYMYPMLVIYEFIGISITVKMINHNKLFGHKFIYFCLIFFILFMNAGGSLIYQVIHYIPLSIRSVKNYSEWNRIDSENIYINKKSIPDNYDNIGDNLSNLIYLVNKKRFFIYKSFIKKDYNNKNKSYKKVFNNINKNINTYHY